MTKTLVDALIFKVLAAHAVLSRKNNAPGIFISSPIGRGDFFSADAVCTRVRNGNNLMASYSLSLFDLSDRLCEREHTHIHTV
jgi:hypothetical protein